MRRLVSAQASYSHQLLLKSISYFASCSPSCCTAVIFLRRDESVLTKRREDLADRRARFEIGGRSTAGSRDRTRSGTHHLVSADDQPVRGDGSDRPGAAAEQRSRPARPHMHAQALWRIEKAPSARRIAGELMVMSRPGIDRFRSGDVAIPLTARPAALSAAAPPLSPRRRNRAVESRRNGRKACA